MSDMLLTDAQVAERLGVSKMTVWRHAKAGLLPKPIKFGNNTRWPESEITAWLERMRAERDCTGTGEAA